MRRTAVAFVPLLRSPPTLLLRTRPMGHASDGDTPMCAVSNPASAVVAHTLHRLSQKRAPHQVLP